MLSNFSRMFLVRRVLSRAALCSQENALGGENAREFFAGVFPSSVWVGDALGRLRALGVYRLSAICGAGWLGALSVCVLSVCKRLSTFSRSRCARRCAATLCGG